MAKKNLVIRVRESCSGDWWDVVLCNGKKILMVNYCKVWERKYAAVRNAKALAKRIGIPYSDKIYKAHGC